MIRVNENVKDLIQKGLNKNKELYGKRYCPCAVEHTDDTVCMCKEFREMKEGTCHCGLYTKTIE